jgi:hypothetical protein
MSKQSHNDRLEEQYGNLVARTAYNALVKDCGQRWWDEWLQGDEPWPPGKLVYRIDTACHDLIFNYGSGLKCEDINRMVEYPPTAQQVEETWKKTYGMTRPRDAVQAYLGLKADCIANAWHRIAHYTQVCFWRIYDMDNNTYLLNCDLFMEKEDNEDVFVTGEECLVRDHCARYYQEYASYGVYRALAIVGFAHSGEILLRDVYEYDGPQ